MWLRNTSRYPTAEVRELVKWAGERIDLRAVGVLVNNSKYACHGAAYPYMPFRALAVRWPGARYLVRICIGRPSLFPSDNLCVQYETIHGWDPDRDAMHALAGRHPDAKIDWAWRGGRIQYRLRRPAGQRPYGGKSSPAIVYRTWQEGLLAVAAHEALHIEQFQYRQRRSEVACERFAAARLVAWRAANGVAANPEPMAAC